MRHLGLTLFFLMTTANFIKGLQWTLWLVSWALILLCLIGCFGPVGFVAGTGTFVVCTYYWGQI